MALFFAKAMCHEKSRIRYDAEEGSRVELTLYYEDLQDEGVFYFANESLLERREYGDVDEDVRMKSSMFGHLFNHLQSSEHCLEADEIVCRSRLNEMINFWVRLTQNDKFSSPGEEEKREMILTSGTPVEKNKKRGAESMSLMHEEKGEEGGEEGGGEEEEVEEEKQLSVTKFVPKSIAETKSRTRKKKGKITIGGRAVK